MPNQTGSSKTPRFDVYDIDGTLTRPGHDLWYLTSKALAEDANQFDARVKQWKQEISETGDVVAASDSMMKDAVQFHSRAEVSADTVRETCRQITTELIQKGLVYSEWLAYVQDRLTQGVTPVLATTNYQQGAQAFLQALVDASWLTPAQADQFVCSGTQVDWTATPRKVLHFNMHQFKAVGVQEATHLSEESLKEAVENVFGDDPVGNDKGILTMTQHHAWVVHTAKNAAQTLPQGMLRMSWMHWTDADKHRLPQGLLGVFGSAAAVTATDTTNSTNAKRPKVENDNDDHISWFGDPKTDNAKKTNIVIVGGGFCGVIVARMLQQQQEKEKSDQNHLSITLIDPKDCFEYVGALPKSIVPRNNTKEGKSNPKGPVSLPFEAILSSKNKNNSATTTTTARHVCGWVERIAQSYVVVQSGSASSSCKKLAYDHLVVATGSSYPAGIKYSFLTALHGLTRGVELHRQQQRVAQAQSILLIGGGSVSLEIATEIATAYPKKQVTIVDRHPRLLPRTLGAHDLLQKRLEELHIQVVLGETVTHVDSQSLEYKTRSGKTFSCDHAIWCGGPQPNGGLVPSIAAAFPAAPVVEGVEESNTRGCLVVDPFLNLPGTNGRVWCGGDACTLEDGVGEEAMAARAMRQGRVIARNIQAAVQAPRDDTTANWKLSLTRYHHRDDKASIASMIVSLGDDHAMVIIGDVPVVGLFRGIKEEVESLLLQQLQSQNAGNPLVDPYTLLNHVDVEGLQQSAISGQKPSLIDILPPEQQEILSKLRLRGSILK